MAVCTNNNIKRVLTYICRITLIDITNLKFIARKITLLKFKYLIQSFVITFKQYLRLCTRWKGNKCHPFNSRRGRSKGPKNLYTM